MSMIQEHGANVTAGAQRPVIQHGTGEDLNSAGQDHSGAHGYATDKEAYLKRLRRIEGQVRGIARMVEEDKYCIDILTQVAAINKALHAVSLGLVQDHMSHCVVDAAREADATGNPELVQAKVQEATDAIGRLLR